MLKRPLCAFVPGPSLEASSWYSRGLSVNLLADVCCRSVVGPTPAGWHKRKGASFNAVTVVWQITEGRAKTDPGEEGLEETALFSPVVPEINEFSSNSGM